MEEEKLTPGIAVLGSLMMAGMGTAEEADRLMAILEEESVGEDWFQLPKERLMFASIQKAWKKYSSLDPFQIKEFWDADAKEKKVALKFVDAHQEAMDAVGTTAHFEHYLRKLKEKYIYAKVHRRLAEFMAETRPESIMVELELLTKSLIETSDKVASKEGRVRPLSDFMKESIEKKRKLHEERFVKHNWEYMDGLPWPWHCMNNIFAGLKKGLHVIGALTSDGKSTMAANLSVFWNERGIKHGYFSIDMAAEQMTDRYPCIAGRVSLAKLNFGGSAQDVAKFEQAYEEMAGLNNVYFSEEDDVGMVGIQTARGVRSMGWKAIIIDYIQLLSAEEKGQMPEYTRVQRVVQSAKRIAKKCNIPVICLAQLSRAFEKELREKCTSPGTDAIGDSAEIARAAASITVLYKDADMVKYWRETPPVQLAFADKHDKAYAYRITSPDQEEAADRQAHKAPGSTAEERRKGQESLAKALRPMWVDVIKNQQGGKAKEPFVMFPNYFLFRPGNEKGEDIEVTVEGKTKKLPVGKFEQLCDDWTYTEQDWWLEMTGAIRQRGCKLLGETVKEMRERFTAEREKHRDVRHFVREYDERGNMVDAYILEPKEGDTK